MVNEIVLTPAQMAELRPILDEFAAAQSALVKCARLLIVSAGEDPNRYAGKVVGKADGGAVIPLEPLQAEAKG